MEFEYNVNEEILLDHQQIIDQGYSFTDRVFPPNLGSVYDPQDCSKNADLQLYSSLEWKRASEIYPNGFAIFKETGEIGCNDVI